MAETSWAKKEGDPMPTDGKLSEGMSTKGIIENNVGHAVCVSCQVRKQKTEMHAIKSTDGKKDDAWICGRCFTRGFA